MVLSSARKNPSGRARVLHADARKLDKLKAESVDVVITSPPYPNRVTTVRELRPYMYWLDFVSTASEVGDLDWRAIGGTWGVATHRLKAWMPTGDEFLPPVIRSVCERIRKEKVESAALLANYVLRYFEDIAVHVREMRRVVRSGGRLHYVVGNSSFYGHVVEVEKAYVDILRHHGFRDTQAIALRKRSSKRELYEFLVTAERP